MYLERFTCQICFESLPLEWKFQNADLCTHPFCLSCISMHIKIYFRSSAGTGTISCPGIECKHALGPFSCRLLVTREQFVKWCDLMCRSALSGIDSCYCPFPNCSALVLNECRDDKLKKTNCPYCSRTFCFECEVPWHAGYRCSDSGNLKDRNDILVGELIERKRWTRFYHCDHSVERVSGCGSINCICGVRFCYLCGGPMHFGDRRTPNIEHYENFVSNSQLVATICLSLLICVPILVLLGVI
ncbi:hypothetical protein Tsubulata_048830 [Turnera subulata]|uniref:RBR-type E3 ubiquitin transferase n=1 Tax=Turnera subulata TaxID=218843 RepID=A0A9Q0GJ83_9ROSI|nr:hypothetical protein Tsubulata_048830 [Turnera subulata]